MVSPGVGCPPPTDAAVWQQLLTMMNEIAKDALMKILEAWIKADIHPPPFLPVLIPKRAFYNQCFLSYGYFIKNDVI